MSCISGKVEVSVTPLYGSVVNYGGVTLYGSVSVAESIDGAVVSYILCPRGSVRRDSEALSMSLESEYTALSGSVLTIDEEEQGKCVEESSRLSGELSVGSVIMGECSVDLYDMSGSVSVVSVPLDGNVTFTDSVLSGYTGLVCIANNANVRLPYKLPFRLA